MFLIISIHALVKRATVHQSGYDLFEHISIHALVKRATCLIPLLISAVIYFNPRPREEGDTKSAVDSIQIGDFNPRPREEGDF